MTVSDKKITFEANEEEINWALDQLEKLDCDPKLKELLMGSLKALVELDRIVGLQATTIARLRKIFGKRLEKNKNKEKKDKKDNPKGGRNPGQGNNGRDQYPDAPVEKHELADDKKAGNKCPDCERGTLYELSPGVSVRISGSPILKATVHETEKTRCSACGKIFEADFAGKEGGKYDASAVAIIAIMHYHASIPFYRLEKLQKQLKTPVSRSVQWELMGKLAGVLEAV